MGFESAIEIRKAITEIEERRWVIPAFQRELVWQPEKMELLFDSLMRDYTIGGMLLWSLEPESLGQFPFYHFVQHYHAHLRRSGDLSALKGRENIKAVIDGQQRLTALFIGLRGTYTAREKYAREANAANWPGRTLHLRLRGSQPEPEDDESDSAAFEFRFLTADQVRRADPGTWFPVPDVMGFDRQASVRQWFEQRKIVAEDDAYDLVSELRRVVWDRPLVSYYLEGSQELHKVVTIFQRLNKYGTPLTTAAIVFSTAVEQWGPEARTEIDTLVARMNACGGPDAFRFSRDFVLKACLVLSGSKSVRFDAGNYGRKNVVAIRRQWPEISAALLVTARLLGEALGYSGSRLASMNATIPIALYLMRRGSPKDFPTGAAWGADRAAIRRWLAATLVRRVFSGHSDTKLTAAREALAGQPSAYPAVAIDGRLRLGPVTDAEVDDLLRTTYGGGAFAVLSLLYPSFRYDQLLDLDHMHPSSLAGNPKKLAQLGLDQPGSRFYADHVNELPNLQLLRHEENNEKRAKPLADYLAKQFPDPDLADRYRRDNHIPDVDLSTANFREFFDERRGLLRAALVAAIGAAELEPRIDPVRHGMSEAEAALVEAARADLPGRPPPTNVTAGLDGRPNGRGDSRGVLSMLTAEPVEVKERALLITINQLYRTGMTGEELYEATRGIWVLGPDRERAQIALAIYQGVVREVYRIRSWHPAGALPYRTRDASGFAATGRWEFDGEVAADIRDRYVGRSVGKGGQNPVRYVNLKTRRSGR